MDLGRFLVEAVVVGGASPTELARSHPISRSWLFRLLARYRTGGPAALEPRSRRPKSCPSRTAPEIERAIIELRRGLSAAGLDAGPQTIAHHLRLRFATTPSRPTIWRILKSQGLIQPQPHKRPKSSWIRLQADLPNELWQADATHWRLADGSKVEILNLLDDHSRFCLASVAFLTVKAPDVLETFYSAAESYGYPAKFLSDNAAVLSGAPRKVGSYSSQSSTAWASNPNTPAPTTPRPAAKLSASTRPSSAICSARRRPRARLTSSSNSTASTSTTTSSDPIAHSRSHTLSSLPGPAQGRPCSVHSTRPVPSASRPARRRRQGDDPLPGPAPPYLRQLQTQAPCGHPSRGWAAPAGDRRRRLNPARADP
jgi:homeodomain-containing protein/integrase-like protein